MDSLFSFEPPSFCRNRLSDILALTSMDQWKFVPGNRNPANCSTRVFPANRLKNCSRIYGPSFLKEKFIPNFEVSLTFTVANPNSQFPAGGILSSEKTCLEESDEGEKLNRQSAPTMPRDITSAALQADYKLHMIP